MGISWFNAIFLSDQAMAAYRNLLVLGVYSLSTIGLMTMIWAKVTGRDLVSPRFGRIHFWLSLIGCLAIPTVLLVSGLRVFLHLSYATTSTLALLLLLSAFAIGLPQLLYSLQVLKFFVAAGVKKGWGVLGIAVGVGLANWAIYGLATGKFGFTLFTGMAVAGLGGFLLFLSIAILLSEAPKPPAPITPK